MLKIWHRHRTFEWRRYAVNTSPNEPAPSLLITSKHCTISKPHKNLINNTCIYQKNFVKTQNSEMVKWQITFISVSLNSAPVSLHVYGAYVSLFKHDWLNSKKHSINCKDCLIENHITFGTSVRYMFMKSDY